MRKVALRLHVTALFWVAAIGSGFFSVAVAQTVTPTPTTNPTATPTPTCPCLYLVTGQVAEFPPCQGAMRGVEVTLRGTSDTGEEVHLTQETDLAAGGFSFELLYTGVYTLSVSQNCNPFGCWRDETAEVRSSSGPVFVRICMDSSGECPCDCNRDGEVTISELITAVRISLRSGDLESDCPAADADGDGEVSINELVAGVNSALHGCG